MPILYRFKRSKLNKLLRLQTQTQLAKRFGCSEACITHWRDRRNGVKPMMRKKIIEVLSIGREVPVSFGSLFESIGRGWLTNNRKRRIRNELRAERKLSRSSYY